MFEAFYPDEYLDSTYSIDFSKLYQNGYRGILFDIDNTLVEHGKKADKRAMKLFRDLKRMGFSCCLVSNNKSQRVSSFHKQVQVPYIERAAKPFKKGYLRAMEITGTGTENTLFVGDQLFTDIFGAKRLGIYTILVEPIHPKEEIQIVLKRFLEKIILRSFTKSRNI